MAARHPRRSSRAPVQSQQSHARAVASLASRPLARQAVSAAVWLTLALQVSAAALSAWLTLDRGYAFRVMVVGTLAMALAVRGVLRAHPHPTLGPANLVTGARAGAVALLAGLALGPAPPSASAVVLAVASASALADLLDGWLARRTGLASRFGARFDMEVDALFILVLAVLAWRTTPAGAWVLSAGWLRYAFVAAGWIAPWMRAELPPSRRRQTLCVLQVVSLLVLLAPGVPARLGVPVAALGVVLLWGSFAIDTRWLARARAVPAPATPR